MKIFSFQNSLAELLDRMKDAEPSFVRYVNINESSVRDNEIEIFFK
jgi:hypothetical protein